MPTKPNMTSGSPGMPRGTIGTERSPATSALTPDASGMGYAASQREYKGKNKDIVQQRSRKSLTPLTLGSMWTTQHPLPHHVWAGGCPVDFTNG